MDKILTFPGKTDRGIFTYVIDAERNYLEKTAAEYHPTIAAYINDAKPLKGKTQVLITALGAGEWWGDNVNGDYFPETALAHPGKDYGYETFTHFAKVYKHHINKDPTKSYGDVLLSVYNPTYHRVELIVSIDHSLAPDIIARIEAGDYPDWSMGCLKATAPILMADLSTKPVSELLSGDLVINGNGATSAVAYPHSHHHKGTWYHVSALGMYNDDIEPTTEEHPWLVIDKDDVVCVGNPENKSRRINLCIPNRAQKKGCVSCPNAKDGYKKIWKRADELAVGDYIATPILKGEHSTPESRMAFLLGLYLAEGHITSDNYVELNVSASDEYLYDMLCEFFPDVSITWNLRDNCANAAKIDLYNKDLAKFVKTHAGCGAHTKFISSDVMHWDYESQKIFLGAYCAGDGGGYKGALYFSTCNRKLADQVRMMLLRVGCISSLNINAHKPSRLVNKDTVEYQVWVGRDSALNLKGYTRKAEFSGPQKMVKNHRFIYDGYLWSPIVGIDTEECDETVYNVAIESGDYHSDSYIVNGVALHNCKVPFDICSICGNKAPTRKQYCNHARYMLGKIDPDTGKKVFVTNTMPKFFDISLVLIGADRIAKTLKKVAYTTGYRNIPILSSAYLAEKAAEQKRAEMEKEVPANEPPASQDNVEKVKDLAKTITEVKAMEPPMPNKLLDDLAESSPLPKILSTMVMMGIIPKPQEFQRIFLISNGQRGLADHFSSRNECFDPMSVESPSPAAIRSLDIGAHNFDVPIMQKMSPFMADRSYLAPHLGKRIIIMIKQGSEYPLPTLIKVSAEDVKKDRKPFAPALALLVAAGAYAALTHSAPKEALSGIDKLIATPEGAALAAALGLGLVSAFNKVTAPRNVGQFSPQNSRVNPDANDVFSRIQEMKQKPFNKVGMQKDAIAKRLILGPSAAYMASGVLQKRRELSPYDEEGRIKSFIRQYPDAISAAFAADAVLSTRGFPLSTRSIYNAIKGAGGKFKKIAEVADELYGSDLAKRADAREFLVNGMSETSIPGRAIGGLFDQALLDSGSILLEKKAESRRKMKSRI